MTAALPPKPRVRGEGPGSAARAKLDDVIERPRWIDGAAAVMTDLQWHDLLARRAQAATEREAAAKARADEDEPVFEERYEGGRFVIVRVS